MRRSQQQPYQQPPYPPLPPPRGYQDPAYEDLARKIKPPSRAPWLLFILVLIGAGYGGWWLFGERGTALARAIAAEAVAAKADAERKTLEAKVQSLEAEKTALVTERDALTKSVEQKSSELAELKGTHDKLQEKMKDEIAQGHVLLTTSGGRLRVDLVDKILFESGDATISKRGQSVLARVGAVLNEIGDKQIQVSGHTDNEPISPKLRAQYPSNWELSSARATNVVRFLQDTAKVPGDRLVASGHGEHQPVGTNKTAKGRARNRRIEILLLPGLAPKRISAAKLKEQARDDDKANENVPAKNAKAASK